MANYFTLLLIKLECRQLVLKSSHRSHPLEVHRPWRSVVRPQKDTRHGTPSEEPQNPAGRVVLPVGARSPRRSLFCDQELKHS